MKSRAKRKVTKKAAKSTKVKAAVTPEKAASTKLKAKANRMKVLYRLSLDDLKAIIDYQKNHPVLYILLGPMNGLRDGTDHNHRTGLIRGRLDWRVNRAYGLLEKARPNDLPQVLRALADFHENPPAIAALGEERYGLIGAAKYKKKMVYGPPVRQATK